MSREGPPPPGFQTWGHYDEHQRQIREREDDDHGGGSGGGSSRTGGSRRSKESSGCGCGSIVGLALLIGVGTLLFYAYQLLTGGATSAYQVTGEGDELADFSGFTVGSCVNGLNLVLINQLPDVADCGQGHEAEVVGQVGIGPGLSDSPPSQGDVERVALERCESQFLLYVGEASSDSDYEMAMFSTSLRLWPELAVVCIAFEPPRNEYDFGSVRGGS